jgi:hypothetical protein
MNIKIEAKVQPRPANGLSFI